MAKTLAEVIIREMTLNDHEEAVTIWENAEGISVTKSDSRDNIFRFLQRNPGLSLVAEKEGRVLGTVMGGHDGRRGYLHHLAVIPEFRGTGLAKWLVDECLERLREEGIEKCHLFVVKENDRAMRFWNKSGWTRRDELEMFSKEL
ncbi:GNAT family N-acetyltransferase [Natranaerobius thermophilus]|uniref:GCN5-related N-acetyltransferase n=1 Tax=Natranaerobius thermophilus (strain ATCC BAA-1301 / DSM 18059 / JW/NM-WN-LF) TaxID=457570 RepID=B2A0S9_NATTJ|nr:GNAT family N-acetyltransferase [Natranaerobius thermophilus]ACB85959.1 GCN5-related N-acetyltransferase [Natranaerobius thermophilus JW/NM-WN-LF]